MPEASETTTDTSALTTSTSEPRSRLFQVAAWVGIVAGVVFVVAVIFFGGFCAGVYSSGGYWHGPYRHAQSQPGPTCTMSPGPMGSGGMTGPGMTGPGMMGPDGSMGTGGMMGPGQMGPGGMPGPVPQTSAPASSATPHHP